MKHIDVSTSLPNVGTQCVVSGWGYTGLLYEPNPYNLRFANVELLDTEECNISYTTLREGMICAGSWEGKRDSCRVNIID